MLRSSQARRRSFKDVTLLRRYDDIAEKATRYRDRSRSWNFLGDNVSVSQPAGYQAGRHRPSTSRRIAANLVRAAANRPSFQARNKGHRRTTCRPAARNN